MSVPQSFFLSWWEEQPLFPPADVDRPAEGAEDVGVERRPAQEPLLVPRHLGNALWLLRVGWPCSGLSPQLSHLPESHSGERDTPPQNSNRRCSGFGWNHRVKGLETPELAASSRPGQGDSPRGSEPELTPLGEWLRTGCRQAGGVDAQLPGAGGPHVDEAVVVHIQVVPVLIEPVGREVHGQGEHVLSRGVPLESTRREDAATTTHPRPTWSPT